VGAKSSNEDVQPVPVQVHPVSTHSTVRQGSAEESSTPAAVVEVPIKEEEEKEPALVTIPTEPGVKADLSTQN